MMNPRMPSGRIRSKQGVTLLHSLGRSSSSCLGATRTSHQTPRCTNTQPPPLPLLLHSRPALLPPIPLRSLLPCPLPFILPSEPRQLMASLRSQVAIHLLAGAGRA
eukprot:3753637-Rhodomonas_salina.1